MDIDANEHHDQAPAEVTAEAGSEVSGSSETTEGNDGERK